MNITEFSSMSTASTHDPDKHRQFELAVGAEIKRDLAERGINECRGSGHYPTGEGCGNCGGQGSYELGV